MLAKATSTLAPPWYNIFSFPQIPTIRHSLSYDYNNETYTDFGLHETDFSEFKDPWETYSPLLDPFLRDIQQITQENPEDSKPGSYFEKFEKDSYFQQSQQNQEPENYFEEHHQLWNDRINERRDDNQGQKESKDFYENETHQEEYKRKEENQKDCHLDYEHKDHQSSLEESQIHQVVPSHRDEHQYPQNFQSKLKEEYNFHSHSHSHSHFHSHSNTRSQVHPSLDKRQKSFSRTQKIPPKGILKNTVHKDKTVVQNKRDIEQDLKQDKQNDKQTKPHRLRSQFPTKTRIVPKKLASQSEQRKKHLESKDVSKRLQYFF